MTSSLAIAVDLGGTQVRAALVDIDANIVDQLTQSTAASAGGIAVLDQIVALIEKLTADLQTQSICGVGLCAPGPLDAQSGIALSTPTIEGFSDLPIGEILSEKLPWTVSIENDGIAAALGEWKHGAGQGFKNLVYITVSTGIGGGIVADGRILHGRMGMAGHIGHMTIIAGGELCPCGNRGCWEAHASGTAFTERAKRAFADSRLELSLGETSLTAKLVFDAARRSNQAALDLVNEEAELLGIGIVNLLHLYSPDVVILGGGMSNDFDLLQPEIGSYVAKCAMPPFRKIPILPTRLKSTSGLIGAASMVFAEHSA